MIGVIFTLGSEVVEVRVDNGSVLFRTPSAQLFTDISGIALSHVGCIKEFPDLKNNKEWKQIVIERFKEKIAKMKTDEERIKYVIDDLTKFGYTAKYIQKAGYRRIKL